MKHLFAIFFIFSFSSILKSQQIEFGYSFGNIESLITNIKSDIHGGNIIVSGKCSQTGSLDFINQISDSLSGYGQSFIASYDTLGNYNWSKKFSCYYMDIITDLAVNINGDVIFSGTTLCDTLEFGFINPVKIGTDTGNYNKTFVISLDKNGEVNWGYFLLSPNVRIEGLCVDPNNNVFIAGYFDDSLVIRTNIDTTIYNDVINSNGTSIDGFWAKLSNTGELMLIKSTNMHASADYDAGYKEIIATSDYVYVGGSIEGQNIDMDPGVGIDLHGTMNNNSNANLSLSKFTSTGDYIWTRSTNSSGSTRFEQLELTSNNEVIGYVRANILTSTNWNYSLQSNPINIQSTLPSNTCLLKYDTSGTVLWVTSMAAYSSSWVYYNSYPLTIDSMNNVYVGAWFEVDSVDVFGGLGPITDYVYGSNANYQSTGVLKKVNSAGDVEWGYAIGGSNDWNYIQGVTAFGNSLFVGGKLAGSTDLDFSDTSQYIISVSNGAFIAKYNINEINNTALAQLKQNSKVKLYPNPVSKELYLDSKLFIREINITDIAGKTIKTFKQDVSTISVEDLSDGIYFLKVITNKSMIVKKFIKY